MSSTFFWSHVNPKTSAPVQHVNYLNFSHSNQVIINKIELSVAVLFSLFFAGNIETNDTRFVPQRWWLQLSSSSELFPSNGGQTDERQRWKPVHHFYSRNYSQKTSSQKLKKRKQKESSKLQSLSVCGDTYVDISSAVRWAVPCLLWGSRYKFTSKQK